MRFFLRQLLRKDVLLAFVVLMSAGTAAAYVYQGMARARAEHMLSIGPFSRGERRINLRSRDGCIGALGLALNVERELSELRISGEIVLQAGDQRIQPTIEGMLSFNNLGQMGSSILKIRSEGIDLMLGTLGLRPMKGIVRGTVAAQPYNLEFPLDAGPFTLEHDKSGAYHIVGALPQQLNQLQSIRSLPALLLPLGVHTQEASSRNRCRPEHMKALDLSPMLGMFQRLLPL